MSGLDTILAANLSNIWIWVVVALILNILFTIIFLASRYKRCPSDRILVLYGRVGQNESAICIHGGGLFVWPLIQNYTYLSLAPIRVKILLRKAWPDRKDGLTGTFTVGFGTEEELMKKAAVRFLRVPESEVQMAAEDIIIGQLQKMEPPQRESQKSSLETIEENVKNKLHEVGLNLINVNFLYEKDMD